MSATKSSGNRIFWGLTLIILGVLFLLDRMGRLDFGEFAGRYWPAVFIIIGLSILLNQGFKKARTGFFFIVFGVICLILRTKIVRPEFWHYAWPVLIIGAGIWLLVKPSSSPVAEDVKKKSLNPPPAI